MPKLTVTNLSTGPLEIQDMSGLSGASGARFSMDLGAAGSALVTSTVSVTRDLLERLRPELDAMQTRAKITWSWADDSADSTDNTRNPVRTAIVSPVTMTALNEVVVCKLTVAGAVAVTLPPLPVAGQVVEVIDGTGDAGSNNITITPATGTINGGANMIIAMNYGRARFVRSATEWLGVLEGALSGAPTGAAAGDLAGAYPNPTVGKLTGFLTPGSAVQTTDATATTLATVAVPTGKTVLIEAHVAGTQSDGSKGAAYIMRCAYRNDGGTLHAIGTDSVDTTLEDDVTWGTISSAISTTNVLIKVVGLAATIINWNSTVYTRSA